LRRSDFWPTFFSLLVPALGAQLAGIAAGAATAAAIVGRTLFGVVPLIVAIGQGFYAFAPATFGLIRELAPAPAGATPYLWIAAAAFQGAAVAAFMLGRRRQATQRSS
jgi:hypothetical protein